MSLLQTVLVKVFVKCFKKPNLNLSKRTETLKFEMQVTVLLRKPNLKAKHRHLNKLILRRWKYTRLNVKICEMLHV